MRELLVRACIKIIIHQQEEGEEHLFLDHLLLEEVAVEVYLEDQPLVVVVAVEVYLERQLLVAEAVEVYLEHQLEESKR